MTKIFRRSLFAVAACCLPVATASASFDDSREDVRAFIDRMHTVHDFDQDYVKKILAGAERQQSILDAISRPAEKSKPWHEYRQIFLTDRRIKEGAEFWAQHADALNAAAEASGVPAEIIVAIIGVETSYGRITGSYRVVDALTTLAFEYPRRSRFFTKELENFFLLSREEDVAITDVKGSYAGAMGAAQFMPSSYRMYAADGDDDGARDLWQSWDDVFASIANYFVRHGWRRDEPSATPAVVDEETAELLATRELIAPYRVKFLREQGVGFETTLDDESAASLIPFEGEKGPEYWVGFSNFYVVTRYNRSRLYALSVLQLADAVRERVAL